MSAPDRINVWLEPDDEEPNPIDDEGWIYGEWDRERFPRFAEFYQYIRSDLHDATQARLEEAERLLWKAYERIMDPASPNELGWGERFFKAHHAIVNDGYSFAATVRAYLEGSKSDG